jgi:hypothetical protein
MDNVQNCDSYVSHKHTDHIWLHVHGKNIEWKELGIIV